MGQCAFYELSSEVMWNHSDDRLPYGQKSLVISKPRIRSRDLIHGDAHPLRAMLETNKQVNCELLEAIQRWVPLHFSYDSYQDTSFADLLTTGTASSNAITQIGESTPAIATMLVNCEFTNFGPADGPAISQQKIVEEKAFRNLTTLLSGCGKLTHLVLRCSLHMNTHLNMEDGYGRHYDPDQDIFFSMHGSCRIVHDHLQAGIESLPNIRCYSINIKITKNHLFEWNQLNYARIPLGTDWRSEHTTRLKLDSYPLLRSPKSRQQQPIREWQPLAEWQALHDLVGAERFTFCGYLEGMVGEDELEEERAKTAVLATTAEDLPWLSYPMM